MDYGYSDSYGSSATEVGYYYDRFAQSPFDYTSKLLCIEMVLRSKQVHKEDQTKTNKQIWSNQSYQIELDRFLCP
jgi:hypothetical protein